MKELKQSNKLFKTYLWHLFQAKIAKEQRVYTNIAFDAKISLIYPKFLRKKTIFHDECSLEAL